MKRERPYSVVTGWVRACLSFAILQTVLLCVHGSCPRWRSLEIVDGTSLPIVMGDVCFCMSVLFYGGPCP